MSEITLTIDGRTVSAAAGDTVLDAARRAGIEIPTLCAHEDLPPFGACRLCIVEIEGVRGFPTSCTTPAAAGMKVRTQSPELEELRNITMEMMLTGHPNSCLVCDHREDCERARPLPTKAGHTTKCGSCSNRSECGIREMTLAPGKAATLNLPRVYTKYKVERDDPFIERNLNLCVLCGRCWRVCEQVHGNPKMSIVGRGHNARIGTAFDRSRIDSGCTFCGACVDICPTGTLTDRFARWYPGPKRERAYTCTVCPQACSMQLIISEGRVVATRMKNFKRPARLCAVGRFGYAQIMDSPERLKRPYVRENGDLTPVAWDEAITNVANALADHQDGSFALVTGEPQTDEARAHYEQLAREVMHGQFISLPANSGADDLPASVKDDINAGKIKALWTTGDYVSEELLKKLEYVVVSDFLPSAASQQASAVLPVSVLAETDGSLHSADGELKTMVAALQGPGLTQQETAVARQVTKALGIDLSHDVTHIYQKPADDSPHGNGRDNIADLPSRFRGHLLADFVAPLAELGLPTSRPAASKDQLTGFLVVSREEVVPNFHKLVVEAPVVARHAKPGQFAILMVNEKSERAPFTLVDWDAERGTITLIVEEVGRSSQEVALLKAGQRIAHVSGPLGLPMPIEPHGTVVLGGGCYGIGAIYPMARAYRQAGSHVIAVIEGCTENMLYMEQELRAVCDKVYIATKDGSRGRKGGVQDVFVKLHQAGLKINQFVAIGCTFMMHEVAKKTTGLGVPLTVGLNPIMVDGTGMCGACRVSVASKTKFACVDGPLFDGHAVDWNELGLRRGAYIVNEIESLPQVLASD